MLLGVAAPRRSVACAVRHTSAPSAPPSPETPRSNSMRETKWAAAEGRRGGGLAHRRDVGGDGALGAELAHREELHLAAAVVGVERDVVDPSRGRSGGSDPGGAGVAGFSGRERGRAGGGGGGAPRRAAEELSLGVGLEGALVLERESTSASARHSSGCGGSSSSRSSSDPTGTFACSPRPGSSTEMTQRPDCSTFRHSTRSDDSTVSRRAAAARQDRAFSFSSAFGAAACGNPLLLALGRRRVGVGGGAAGSIAAAGGRCRPTAPSWPARRAAQPLLAELQRDAQRRGALRAVDHRPRRRRGRRGARGEASALSTARPPPTARPPRAAPPPLRPRSPSSGRRGVRRDGKPSARMRLRSAKTPFSERWRWIRVDVGEVGHFARQSRLAASDPKTATHSPGLRS